MPDQKPARFTASVNLTVDELSELCDLTSDAVIAALNGTQPTSDERILTLRRLFVKAHNAWQEQIIAPEVGDIVANAVQTGEPIPPAVAAYVAGDRIPLEVPTAQPSTNEDDPHTCGHFHPEGTPCPGDGRPCGDYRCCRP